MTLREERRAVRRQLARLRKRETMHARSVRWHLKRGGNLAEAALNLAWLMQARTAREVLESTIAGIEAEAKAGPKGAA